MILKIGLTLLLLASIVGCATNSNISRSVSSTSYTDEVISNYQLGSTLNAYVGSPIIQKGIIRNRVTSGKTFLAIADRKVGQMLYNTGKPYTAIAVDLSDGDFYIQGDIESTEVFAVKVNKEGVVTDSSAYVVTTNGVVKNQWTKDLIESGVKLFEPQALTSVSPTGSFKEEIIYLGSDGNTVKALYREYKDDIARPAFAQELTYNLENKTGFIRFRNFRIDVKNYDSEKIVYVVTEH
jgi:hypothetical protein